MDPDALAGHDVVLTTYSIVQGEHSARFRCNPSPASFFPPEMERGAEQQSKRAETAGV